MNERIKELYEQSLIRETDKDHAGNPMLVIKQNPEKFAELIVRECLEACSRANEIRHFVSPTQQQVVLGCMDEIERTFRS